MSPNSRRTTNLRPSFDDLATDWPRTPKSKSMRRKTVPFIGFVIGLSSLAVVALFYSFSNSAVTEPVADGQQWEEAAQPLITNVTHAIPHTIVTGKPKKPADALLLGAPSQGFRGNLRDNFKYITSFSTAGWTNQAMSFFNLLYLSTITDRIPIVPPFAPSNIHMKGDAGYLDFGKVFDLQRLGASMNKPILEWWQVKDRHSTQVDEIGCWSIFATTDKNQRRPVFTTTGDYLKLDVSYTAIPESAQLPADPNFAMFWGLAAITFPQYRQEHLEGKVAQFPSPAHKHTMLPDDSLTCFDFPYFVAAAFPYEHDHDYSPSWRAVGKYARWNPQLQDLAEQYLRRLFKVSTTAAIPPFITIHARRADFKDACYGVPKEECFPPLSAYARRVLEVQEEIREKRGVSVTRVIVTSDESDAAWWEEVRQLGWTWVDHVAERTEETYGIWYSALLDTVFQSMGTGFVGTAQSTMSLIAKRRVEDWHGGVARIVKWGTKDADAH